jgi:hypothetical protein
MPARKMMKEDKGKSLRKSMDKPIRTAAYLIRPQAAEKSFKGGIKPPSGS